jgi:hypothetical protein
VMCRLMCDTEIRDKFQSLGRAVIAVQLRVGEGVSIPLKVVSCTVYPISYLSC